MVAVMYHPCITLTCYLHFANNVAFSNYIRCRTSRFTGVGLSTNSICSMYKLYGMITAVPISVHVSVCHITGAWHCVRCSYKELNVRCSDKYRRYSGTVLPFLCNRPHDVIHHIMRRYADGKQFSAEKVLQKGDGIFEVESASVSGVKYMLSFNIDGMPRCDCFDWKRFHLPCKHFCAIFHLYPDYGWDRLPAGYRDSPFFTVHETIVGTHNDVQQSAVDSNAEPLQNDASPTAVCEDHDSADASHSLRNAKAALCREVLCTLTNCTYLVDSADALDVLHQSLLRSYEELTPFVPSDGGLHLNSEQHARRQCKKRCRPSSVTGRRMEYKSAGSNIPLRPRKKGWCHLCSLYCAGLYTILGIASILPILF